MGYANLADCVADLERHGQLRRIDAPLDPNLELACIQRRTFQAKGPALLFTRPRGCKFPMLANLFGTRERVNFIFRDSLERVKEIFEAAAEPAALLRQPQKALRMAPALLHCQPKKTSRCPVLASSCQLSELPKLVSWHEDGGPFITLPLVLSEDPQQVGSFNLGMYRVQLSGNDYQENEVGVHYQLMRGIGIHHAKALALGQELPLAIHTGGPPALTIAAVMPLPEGMNELMFAGLLGGRRVRISRQRHILADADFVLQGKIGPATKPEGPFGDHLGYYSLRHDFPVMRVHSVHHRQDAIWPFTSVGRPPQEDTVFGDLIHELTAPLVGKVFKGLKEIRAVDAAGVHPLLLAIGSERYTPWEKPHTPRELLTLAMHLLGTTQTALAKYILITTSEDDPGLSCNDCASFLQHLLKRTNFRRDLHFLTQATCDTLDYSGYKLHEGSRLIWAANGPVLRKLGTEIHDLPDLPQGFSDPRLVMPGILAIKGPGHTLASNCQDELISAALCDKLGSWPARDAFPMIIVADDPGFCAASLNNFLWVTFTRSDPARDIYGAFAETRLKRWSCEAPLVIDARHKQFEPSALEDEPALTDYIETLAKRGGPLEGLF